jgi:hypothetical protein
MEDSSINQLCDTVANTLWLLYWQEGVKLGSKWKDIVVTNKSGRGITIPGQYHLILAQFHLKLVGTTFYFHLILTQMII